LSVISGDQEILIVNSYVPPNDMKDNISAEELRKYLTAHGVNFI